MKTEKFDNAVNGINPELIEEAAFVSNEMQDDKTVQNESASEVAGVEKYHHTVWRKVIAAASVLIVVGGIGIGGAFMLKGMRNANNTVSTDEVSEIPQETMVESSAPFGDISGGRVRFMTPAYAPNLLDTEPETVKELADIFNSGTWDELDGNAPVPDGENVIVFVNDNVQQFRLVFYYDNTADYEINGSTFRYKVSEEITEKVWSDARQTNEALVSHLIPCRTEDLNPEGVWKNNEPMPEKMFEAPAVPDEYKGMNIIEYEPLYEYAYDFSDIAKDVANSDNIIIGTVDSISYKPRGGVAYTQINITVSEDVAGSLSAGEQVSVELAGGYISMRESYGDMLYQTGGKYGEGIDMTEEEIDNTCHYEKVLSGDLPLIGKEYAFLVAEKGEESYNIVGQEYGILYKCDNLYISRDYVFYKLYELEYMMENKSSENDFTEVEDIEKDYKLNSKGQTYGTGAAAEVTAELPDLVRVMGDNGVEGYVYAYELIGESPKSPEEAVAIQKKREESGETSEVIPVYDSEGENVIDTLTMQSFS